MWKRYSMMGDHHGSKWAWLLSALVVVFGAIIYAADTPVSRSTQPYPQRG